MEPDDLAFDGISAAEEAVRAVEAMRNPSHGALQSGSTALFNKGGSGGCALSSLSSSFKLTQSFNELPHDDFLKRLSNAERMPSSPASLKGGPPRRSSFDAMAPRSPMALAH